MKTPVIALFVLFAAGCADKSHHLTLLSQSEEITKTVKAESKVPPPPFEEAKISVKKAEKAQKATEVVKKPKKKVVKQQYTIQVVALSYESGLKEFSDMLPSDQPVWSNMKMVDSIPWYTLLYGSFTSKERAKNELNALPRVIKEQKPFIRSISSVKKSPYPKMNKLN
ncbi:SPOR domain-containing protein [Veronia pacifica]|uniref:SPOR domain-containing protein n=1 Tax=Veronia pacifica TaxID=1080227 RepID=A0A1C3EAJ0_9GAMM|nr:SPOR domain-containing protein [Veronia pacifica]ODA30271.1 hypothetical protein A8L45_20585 [Veronia pacifica]